MAPVCICIGKREIFAALLCGSLSVGGGPGASAAGNVSSTGSASPWNGQVHLDILDPEPIETNQNFWIIAGGTDNALGENASPGSSTGPGFGSTSQADNAELPHATLGSALGVATSIVNQTLGVSNRVFWQGGGGVGYRWNQQLDLVVGAQRFFFNLQAPSSSTASASKPPATLQSTFIGVAIAYHLP